MVPAVKERNVNNHNVLKYVAVCVWSVTYKCTLCIMFLKNMARYATMIKATATRITIIIVMHDLLIMCEY